MFKHSYHLIYWIKCYGVLESLLVQLSKYLEIFSMIMVKHKILLYRLTFY